MVATRVNTAATVLTRRQETRPQVEIGVTQRLDMVITTIIIIITVTCAGVGSPGIGSGSSTPATAPPSPSTAPAARCTGASPTPVLAGPRPQWLVLVSASI